MLTHVRRSFSPAATPSPSPARSLTPAAPTWSQGIVRDALGEDRWGLLDGRQVLQAVSCLVKPVPNDRVLVATMADGADYILHVLVRELPGSATLAVPGAEHLLICQHRVDVCATQSIALRAMDSVELTAVRGSLSLNARNLFASAAESLVQTARSYIGQVEQFVVNASQLLHLRGEQMLITARKDAKIDAERISLG